MSGYGPSLQDQGYGLEDMPEPPQPRCEHCGAFLAWAPEIYTVVVGYPGDEFTEERFKRTCRRCGKDNLWL